jgi:hypothetical protein
MKKIIYLIFPLFILSGCSKEKNILCFISSQSENGIIKEVYEYDTDNKISLIKTYDDDGFNIYNLYPQYQSGKVKNITFKMEPFNEIYMFLILGYNPLEQLNYITVLEDTNHDGFAEELDFIFGFIYNSNNKLDTFAVYNSSYDLLTKIAFVWSGENISRINYPNGSYFLYTYDDNINLYHQQPELFLAMQLFDLNFKPLSANNITRIKKYDSNDILLTEEIFTYSYNEEGKVISINGNKTIDYRCIEQE